jgi:predicted dehydrogenase
MGKQLKAGILGYGRMGRAFVAAMQDSKLWDVAAIYDIKESTRRLARVQVPGAAIYEDSAALFADPTIDVMGLFTLADARPQQIRQSLANGKHVLAEKPIAADIATEWQLVRDIEASDRLVAVNLFNRNAWYHKQMQEFIAAGEIGELAVIRICHMTPGHMPLEGHDPEGPPFHDCGMHYVDVARWYARSEFHTWHAQGIRIWGHKDPWWVQAHGTFVNGVVFDITQVSSMGIWRRSSRTTATSMPSVPKVSRACITTLRRRRSNSMVSIRRCKSPHPSMTRNSM